MWVIAYLMVTNLPPIPFSEYFFYFALAKSVNRYDTHLTERCLISANAISKLTKFTLSTYIYQTNLSEISFMNHLI
jgi:hypothetical protein